MNRSTSRTIRLARLYGLLAVSVLALHSPCGAAAGARSAADAQGKPGISTQPSPRAMPSRVAHGVTLERPEAVAARKAAERRDAERSMGK